MEEATKYTEKDVLALANENATLHDAIKHLERENRKMEAECGRLIAINENLRRTIDTLQNAIIAQAIALDRAGVKGDQDEE